MGKRNVWPPFQDDFSCGAALPCAAVRVIVGDSQQPCHSCDNDCMRSHSRRDSDAGRRWHPGHISGQKLCSHTPTNEYKRVNFAYTWGGECTCPDGKAYLVSDNGNGCKTLNCFGGKTTKKCSEPASGTNVTWAGMGVTCASASTHVNGTLATGRGAAAPAQIIAIDGRTRSYTAFVRGIGQIIGDIGCRAPAASPRPTHSRARGAEQP